LLQTSRHCCCYRHPDTAVATDIQTLLLLQTSRHCRCYRHPGTAVATDIQTLLLLQTSRHCCCYRCKRHKLSLIKTLCILKWEDLAKGNQQACGGETSVVARNVAGSFIPAFLVVASTTRKERLLTLFLQKVKYLVRTDGE